MKINILTQPLFSNYGGILQNYALQEVLCRLGHEPLTINVPKSKPGKGVVWKDSIKTIINLVKRCRGEYDQPFLNPHKWACKEHELSFPQREFIQKYIKKKDIPAPFTPNTAAECSADMWIVGSDQVWRPWCNRYIGNEFFDFLDDTTPRIAYAASFGTDQWEIPEDKTPQIKELAKKFKAISVREVSGVTLCKDYLDVEAEHVLDPTILLTAGDYLKLTKESDHPEGDYIATYILDVNSDKTEAIKKIGKEKGLKVCKIGKMHKDRYDSIESWIATIANARCVITDSFHGTVFSLIFGRPVKVLSNHTRGNSRLQSLFNQLHLIQDAEGFINLNDENISQLNNLRDKSLKFLKNSLTKNG